MPPPIILGPLASIAAEDKDCSIGSSYGLNVERTDRKVVKDALEIRRLPMWDKLLWREFDPKGRAGRCCSLCEAQIRELLHLFTDRKLTGDDLG